MQEAHILLEQSVLPALEAIVVNYGVNNYSSN
jgi:hypothetical protein